MPSSRSLIPPEIKAKAAVAKRKRLEALEGTDDYRTIHQRKYWNDPAGWVRDCLLWNKGEDGASDYQNEIMTALPIEKRVSARGPHGIGKSSTAAWIVLWYSDTRDGKDWKVATTASAHRQLTKYLWPEIHKWVRRIRWDVLGRKPYVQGKELLDLSLKLTTGEAFAVASDNSDLIEGAHADNLLFLFDESKSIPPDTWDAVEGAFSSGVAYAFSISTPGEPNGRFFDIQSRKAGYQDWWVRHVSKEEAIASKRISREWADARKKQWGEDSAVYQNRVEGNFAASEEDGIIPLTYIERAIERWHELNETSNWGRLTKLGVDVGRGGDPTIIARAHGMAIKEFEESNERTIMPVTGRIKGIMDANKQVRAVIDVIGVGAGVVDRLREFKLFSSRIIAFSASASTHAKDKTREFGFVNCLTEDAKVKPVGELLRLYRSRYQGAMYRVKVSSGDDFTTTPNHKVLTLRGWVSVETLRVGDKLCNPAFGYSSSMTGVDPKINQVIPKIGDVYCAANRLFGAERVQSGAVNFHGDSSVNNVDVVTVNRDLLSVNPISRQSWDDIQLIRSLLGERPLLGQSLLSQGFGFGNGQKRVSSVLPYRNVSCCTNLPLSKSKSVQREIIGFCKGSRPDAAIAQKACDGTFRNLEQVTQCLDGVSAIVPIDNLFFVNFGGSRKAQCFNQSPTFNSVFTQYAPDYIPVNPKGCCDKVERLPRIISIDNVNLIDFEAIERSSNCLRSWLDVVFAQDAFNDIRTDTELIAQRIERLTGLIPLNDVVGIELVEDVHDNSFVYTMETTTGAYYTTNAVHKNCRAWAWWTVRELLQDDLIALPPNDDMIGELTTPKYQMMSGGRIQVESKDDIKKRIGRSTNYADAVVQVFWKSDTGPSLVDIARYAGTGDITVTEEEDNEMDSDIQAYMKEGE